MVNIDDLRAIAIDKLGGQNLHITRQNNQIDIFLVNQCGQFGFIFGFHLFTAKRVIRQLCIVGPLAPDFMIGGNGGNVHV